MNISAGLKSGSEAVPPSSVVELVDSARAQLGSQTQSRKISET